MRFLTVSVIEQIVHKINLIYSCLSMKLIKLFVGNLYRINKSVKSVIQKIFNKGLE